MNIDFTKLVSAEAKAEEAKKQLIQSLTSAVQSHLDSTVKVRGYDGIMSLCTYATSTNPAFAAEGQAGVAWRDAVWAKCYEVMQAVLSAQRQAPSTEQLIAELPTFTWP